MTVGILTTTLLVLTFLPSAARSTQSSASDDVPESHHVNFAASFSGHVTLSDATFGPLTFNTETSRNQGQGYNPRTGVFSAPVNGIYSFYTSFHHRSDDSADRHPGDVHVIKYEEPSAGSKPICSIVDSLSPGGDDRAVTAGLDRRNGGGDNNACPQQRCETDHSDKWVALNPQEGYSDDPALEMNSYSYWNRRLTSALASDSNWGDPPQSEWRTVSSAKDSRVEAEGSCEGFAHLTRGEQVRLTRAASGNHPEERTATPVYSGFIDGSFSGFLFSMDYF